jgi:Holliday junction resolvase
VGNKGARRERQFAREIADADGAVMRSPSSGSATAREQPDVLFSFGDTLYAVELKSSGGEPIYIEREEVDKLIWFARKMGAEPRIVSRWDRDTTFYFHELDRLHRTPAAGSYRVKKEERDSAEFTLADLAGED